MTTLQSEDDCQINDPNDLFPMFSESLPFSLDNSMQIVFTGYYNGFNVEVKSVEESALLYHMGCFGKGSSSRSYPKISQNHDSPVIMRRRQFLKRNYWHKKFCISKETSESDLFLKELDEVTAKIVSDSEKSLKRDVIDLVSSDDEMSEDDCEVNIQCTFHSHDKGDVVVIVPNSDSEGENYFANMKPKCCLNKVKLQEKLMLTLQEAFFLLYGLGCLRIVHNQNLLSIEQCWELFCVTDRNFLERYVVYHYFRSKGYVVKPGIKFGGDYLLYKEGPRQNHADYIVVIKFDNGQIYDWLTMFGHSRMATTTVKDILFAEVVKPAKECTMPKGLSLYSVREILLTKNMSVKINEDD